MIVARARPAAGAPTVDAVAAGGVPGFALPIARELCLCGLLSSGLLGGALFSGGLFGGDLREDFTLRRAPVLQDLSRLRRGGDEVADIEGIG